MLVALCIAFFSSGCLYGNFTTVLDTDLDKTHLGDKVGKARVQSVFWLVAWGDGVWTQRWVRIYGERPVP
jgi:hypothetical protein